MVKKMGVEEELGEVIDFSTVYRSRNPFNTDKIAKIDEYINKVVIIEDFRIDQGEKYDFISILAYDPESNEHVTLRTTSKVIKNQLLALEEVLKQGRKVKVTIKKTKRYLTFA